MSLINNLPNAQLKMILNNLDMAICLVEKDGQLLYWNNVYLQMLKCDGQEFISRYGNAHKVVDYGYLDRSYSLEVVRRKTKAEGCQTLRDIHGAPQYLYATHLPIFDTGDKLAYSLGIIQYVERIKRQYFSVIEKLDKVIGGNLLQGFDADDEIIYKDPKMTKLMYNMKNIAMTDATVLLQGESGTGKELFAQFIHNNSSRSNGNMISVNCAAIPADLFEAELFGYEGGAFTGATKVGKRGLIEEAEGGTLFLDEINSMPIALQSKLLRAIEQKTIRKVGSSKQKHIDFRLITATNTDLQECVHNNTFRLDLYFRLNVVSINIPPLRERKDDIIPLVQKFISYYGERYHREKVFSSSSLEQLQDYKWPGNVRELKNLLERIFILSDPLSVEITNIADYFFCHEEFIEQQKSTDQENKTYLIDDLTFEENVEYYERRILKEALEKYKSPKEVETHLNLSHATIFRKMNKYNLKRYYQ